jgi:hypothetical protein
MRNKGCTLSKSEVEVLRLVQHSGAIHKVDQTSQVCRLGEEMVICLYGMQPHGGSNVKLWLKARKVQQKEVATAKQQHHKQVFIALNQHTTDNLLKVVFSVHSMVMLHNENPWGKLVNQRLDLAVSYLE